jgi:phosphoribosyl 1,2-cyclic phosphodiesterase
VDGVIDPYPRLIPIASSSKANCTAIVAGGRVIIVDAGISRRATIARLSDLGVLTAEKPAPDALLLTHEHSDHAKYVPDWLKHSQGIWATMGTARKLGLVSKDEESGVYTAKCQWCEANAFDPDLRIDPLTITPMRVPHDAADPVAWRVAWGGRAAIVATDLGDFPAGWDLFCRGCTDLLLEANYHPRLLAACSYLDSLKTRIGAAGGHMSVLRACEWIQTSLPKTMERLYIGHLSKVANDPRIVWSLVKAALAEAGRGDVTLEVLEE